MGQYHMIVNIDRKEYLCSNGGLKLLEWGYLNNPMNLTLLDKMTKEWKSNRIYVIGDYANSLGVKSVECSKIIAELEKEFNNNSFQSIYNLIHNEFKETPLKNDLKLDDYRYIYNHDTGQYIDLEHCVPADSRFDFYKSNNKIKFQAIAPLPLLIALSNDLGGGDYHEGCYNYNLVGSWVNNTKALEVRKEKLNNDYKELIPEFQEGIEYMSYSKANEIKKIIEEQYIDLIKDNTWIKKEFIECVIKGKNPLLESKKKDEMER